MKKYFFLINFLIFCKISFCQVYPIYNIPVVANGEGAYGSYWQTDLYITNLEKEAISVSFDLFINDGTSYEKEVILNPLENIVIEDILFNIFSLKNLYGSLSIEARFLEEGNLAKIIVNTKVYNKNNEGIGTYGQTIIAIPPASNEYIHYLNGIINNGKFRSNIGIFCIGGGMLKVEYYDKNGSLIFEDYMSLYSSGTLQKRVPVQGENIYALLRYISGEGYCGSYTSQVDNKTNDGSFFPCYFIRGGIYGEGD